MVSATATRTSGRPDRPRREGDARVSQREGLGCHDLADLARHPRIRQIVQAHIDRHNADLADFEAIRQSFAVPEAEFTEATGRAHADRQAPPARGPGPPRRADRPALRLSAGPDVS
jgi:hypothetical protein